MREHTEQFASPDLGDELLKNLMRARSFARELPLMATQILMDLEKGKLQIGVQNPLLDTIARNIEALGITVFLGLIAGGLVTGSFFLLARYELEMWVPIVTMSLAGGLLGAAFGWYFLTPRLRKISVSRWLGRRRRR